MHAEQPFPDPRKHAQDLAASQALQPVPGTLNASRAPSGAVAGSMPFSRQAQHAQQAAGEQGQDDLAEELDELASTGEGFGLEGFNSGVVSYMRVYSLMAATREIMHGERI